MFALDAVDAVLIFSGFVVLAWIGVIGLLRRAARQQRDMEQMDERRAFVQRAQREIAQGAQMRVVK